jgi:cytochrome c oxidase subunit II
MNALLPLLLFAGPQSALDAGGEGARTIANLFWYFLIVLGVIFVIVIAVMLGSILRRHRASDDGLSAGAERRLTRSVGIASGLTVVILLGLIVLSVSAGKTISDRAVPPNPLTIEVTGNQWWWNIRYTNDYASRILVTANEMHIPVGRPVVIRGSSNHVIHSLWIPGLEGKRDLIPSRVTTEWFEATKPGRFRGQCAEFCGLQHAHMALWVVAEEESKFNEWMAAQLKEAHSPSTPSEERGQHVFLDHACVICHTIQGTTAAGQVAPDLTHLASRLTIAAGTLPNNRGNLAGWIADPQSVKPGNHMATVPIASEDMQPLLDYLESLQ